MGQTLRRDSDTETVALLCYLSMSLVCCELWQDDGVIMLKRRIERGKGDDRKMDVIHIADTSWLLSA